MKKIVGIFIVCFFFSGCTLNLVNIEPGGHLFTPPPQPALRAHPDTDCIERDYE